jgi:hypothetical protein
VPIDPPITFRPTSVGHDPEPMGSDRFATLMGREAGTAGAPSRPGRRRRRFERESRRPVAPPAVPKS